MVKKNLAVMIILLAALAFVLSACGKKDEYELQYGIGGSVYVPQRIQGPEGLERLDIYGDYLYYSRPTGNKICRVSVAPLRSGEGSLDFSQAEEVLQVPNSLLKAPDYIIEALEVGDFPSFQNGEGQEGIISSILSLTEYTVDQEQSLYYFVSVYTGSNFSSLEEAGGVLCKQNADGEPLYQIYFPEMESITADGAGRAYVLAGDDIVVLDRDGSRLSRIAIDKYNPQDSNSSGELFGDSEGRVYYGIVSNSTRTRKGYEIVGKGEFRLEETNMFAGMTYESYSAAPGGKMLLFSNSSLIYEYDTGSGSTRRIANLEDRGLSAYRVRSSAQVSEDSILLVYGDFGETTYLYLLTRTPIEELEEEYIVIASVYPTMDLTNAAKQFNMLNSQYKVVFDDYGAGHFASDKTECLEICR